MLMALSESILGLENLMHGFDILEKDDAEDAVVCMR